jgi:hypothetical protein
MPYIDVLPLQEPEADHAHLLYISEKPLAISDADFARLMEMLGGDPDLLSGRELIFSVCEDGIHIRIESRAH